MYDLDTGTDEETELVNLWHSHRISIVYCLLAVLLALRYYLRDIDKQDDRKATKPSKPRVEPFLVAEKSSVANGDTKKTESNNGPRRIKGGIKKKTKQATGENENVFKSIQPIIFYSTVTAGTEKIAKSFQEEMTNSSKRISEETGKDVLEPQLNDLADIDFEDYFVSPPKLGEGIGLFYLFLIPSFNIDTINDTFLQHLEETHNDFRIDTGSLSGLLGYSVFGFGDREGWPNEAEGYCFQAKQLDKWMAKLTSKKRAYPVGMGDMKSDHVQRLKEWSEGIYEVITHLAKTGNLGEGAPGSGNSVESDEEDLEEYDDGEVLFDDEAPVSKKQNGKALDDVEDLGKMIRSDGSASKKTKAPIAIDFTTSGPQSKTNPVKEMVAKDSPTYAALTKQGYSIVGSHSGVKICRWTKSALRGRGSCYKYSLYGINSHQCMETTPSLSCSNKCVFCWRHGTNPVGTTWRWVVDPPDMIFDGVKENHYKKIKMLRGMPGVRAERFSEAMRIRHCALSLVGEPIFYPYINEFLALLHGERISSFLVCNAQHPDQLAALKAVTQLYVSIDASNKDSLKKIDRPLHRDFWERFQRCLDILREKRFRHRTVYRLTLVKGFNVEDEVNGYAELVERGLPCFVEVKGVTFCGTSTSSSAGLRMTNVPFYWEVCEFVKALEKKLKEKGLRYGIAAEHAHSCCVLLASERFLVDGKWHTHIDYEKFFQLLEERGPDGDWMPEDYMGPPTPEWALWGNGGFDPRDDRVDRKGNKVEVVVNREPPVDAW